MVKITVDVEGMACGMCEAHVNDAVRSKFAVKKVTSSHTKGKTEILAEAPIDEEALKQVITDSGYTALRVQSEPYEKKGFSLFGRK
jgi:copper chaperone CopZ